MQPHANWPRPLRAPLPEARLALAGCAALVLAACATTETRIETSGTMPAPASVSIRLPEPDPETTSALLQALETRAIRGMEASGLRVAAGAAAPPPGLDLQLGFSVRQEGSGAYVPGEGGAQWAARPQRRGFLQPVRLIYTVDVRLVDRGSGAETVRARALSQQPKGDAQAVLEQLTDLAVAALATGR